MELLEDERLPRKRHRIRVAERDEPSRDAEGPAMRIPGRIGGASGWDRYAKSVEILRQHHLQTWARLR
jgi:hypothetical protein